MEKVSVSICIATRNRAEHLKHTLESLEQVHVPAGWEVEFILVDNGSKDDTLSVMNVFSHPDMKSQIIQEVQPGKSRALNRAIEESKGNIILFTDDDVRLPGNWIEGMCSKIIKGEADAVVGGVELASEVQKDWMTSEHRAWLASTERISPEQPEHMVGANMAVGTHVFELVPKFDTELGGGALGNAEDTLFGWQVAEAGFRIKGALDVVVEHHPDTSRLTRKQFCKMAENRGRSEAYVNYHWRKNSKWNWAPVIAGIVLRGLNLYYWRFKNLNKVINRDLISMEELHLIKRFYRVKQHLIELRKEVKYSSPKINEV